MATRGAVQPDSPFVPDPVRGEPHEDVWAIAVRKSRGLHYGSIEIVIQNGKPVRVIRTESEQIPQR